MHLTCAIIIAALLAGCTTASVKVDGCTIFSPIYGSKQDTAGTRSQVDAHNARGIGACGWSGK